jgi:WD40 repeat protein
VRKNLVSSSTPASHKAAVTALAWSASGKRLATASLDGAIKVWLVSPDTVHTVSRDQQLLLPAMVEGLTGFCVAVG